MRRSQGGGGLAPGAQGSPRELRACVCICVCLRWSVPAAGVGLWPSAPMCSASNWGHWDPGVHRVSIWAQLLEGSTFSLVDVCPAQPESGAGWCGVYASALCVCAHLRGWLCRRVYMWCIYAFCMHVPAESICPSSLQAGPGGHAAAVALPVSGCQTRHGFHLRKPAPGIKWNRDVGFVSAQRHFTLKWPWKYIAKKPWDSLHATHSVSPPGGPAAGHS